MKTPEDSLREDDDTELILRESITPDRTTDVNELASIIQHLPENTPLVKVFGDRA